MSAGPERIGLQRLAPQRWKNGAGLTREVAVAPCGAGSGDFDWRISVAEIAADGPFSVFAGVDRCIVLLQGRGMSLHRSDGSLLQRLDQPLQPFAFSGDDPLSARLIDGPSVDFNLMLRRGRFTGEVTTGDDGQSFEAADATLVLCCAGSAMLESEHGDSLRLDAMECLLWRDGSPALRVSPAAGSRTLVARLQRLCQDGAA